MKVGVRTGVGVLRLEDVRWRTSCCAQDDRSKKVKGRGQECPRHTIQLDDKSKSQILGFWRNLVNRRKGHESGYVHANGTNKLAAKVAHLGISD